MRQLSSHVRTTSVLLAVAHVALLLALVMAGFLALIAATRPVYALAAPAIYAGDAPGGDDCNSGPGSESGACSLDDGGPLVAITGADAGAGARTGSVDAVDAAAVTSARSPRATLIFFWGVGCSHCEEAKPFVEALEKEEPELRVERVEVRHDPEGRRRFIDTMKQLDDGTVAGVPTFVVGKSYVVGYSKGETEGVVRGFVRDALSENRIAEPATKSSTSRPIALPLIGNVDPASISLPTLTILIGLIDGVNPCAMWVLIVLLGILLHVKSRSRMVLYAAMFILMSGVVYFIFMSAWAILFQLVGFSRIATMILGCALLGMGLINLKEVVWFKKGPSLVIPDRVKPSLFRRMRTIAGAVSVPAALGGILVLAFVVNLIELGCTIGLPAVYTRVLSTRSLSVSTRYAYLVLYNVAYVVPLFVIALAFIVLRRRLSMKERMAKGLKGVSGVLLIGFGALSLFAPSLLLEE